MSDGPALNGQMFGDTSGSDGESLPCTIQGQLVRLRPIAKIDLPALFAWRNDGSWPIPFARRSDRVTLGGLQASDRVLDFDTWCQTELPFVLQSGVAFLSELSPQRLPLGVLLTHTFSDIHGWAYYREFFPGRLWQSMQAVEATALCLDYLFSRYPLRKLYTEVLVCDEGPLEKLKYAGFQEEIRLEEDIWFGESFRDYVYLGLFREEWAERRTSYLADLASRPSS